MAYYAITYVYAAPEEQAKYRPAHREYLGSQIEAGNLIVSGRDPRWRSADCKG